MISIGIIITCVLFLFVAWRSRTSVWREELEDIVPLAFVLGWIAGALVLFSIMVKR